MALAKISNKCPCIRFSKKRDPEAVIRIVLIFSSVMVPNAESEEMKRVLEDQAGFPVKEVVTVALLRRDS